MPALLPLTPDELLTTTRSVRKRLDFSRPVERPVVEECLAIAQHAPTGSNLQNWSFVVVSDPAKRLALADVYHKGWAIYETLPIAAGNLHFADPERNALQGRVMNSARYLAEHMHEAPILVIPCITFPGARVESQGALMQSAMWGSIAQAGWSFMLAARARGLGTTWTCLHLLLEEEAAQILGIPYAQVNQAGLIPVAYSLGTEFKPSTREPIDTVVHWETW